LLALETSWTHLPQGRVLVAKNKFDLGVDTAAVEPEDVCEHLDTVKVPLEEVDLLVVVDLLQLLQAGDEG
jgi:hypothetical protein